MKMYWMQQYRDSIIGTSESDNKETWNTQFWKVVEEEKGFAVP